MHLTMDGKTCDNSRSTRHNQHSMQNPVIKPTLAKLIFLENFGFRLGDAARNFVWGTITSFLLFDYTDNGLDEKFCLIIHDDLAKRI
jgi:hypothetical protein